MKQGKKQTRFIDVKKHTKEPIIIHAMTDHVQSRLHRLKAFNIGNTQVDCFLCDSGSGKGLEKHFITPNATLFILNKHNTVVTITNLRKSQMMRYFNQVEGLEPSLEQVANANYNLKKGLN